MKKLIDALKNSTDLSTESIRRSIKESLFFISLMAIVLFLAFWLPSFASAADYGGVIGYSPKGKYIKNAWCEPKQGMYGETVVFCYKEGAVYSSNNFPMVGMPGYYGQGYGWEGIAMSLVEHFGHSVIEAGRYYGHGKIENLLLKERYKMFKRAQGFKHQKNFSRHSKTQGRGW